MVFILDIYTLLILFINSYVLCLYIKTKHFDRYILIVLMTIEGSKSEFTLDWLKNVNENEKCNNIFYLFSD